MSDPVATSRSTQLCDLLGCDVPVLLAGMGGVAHWDLAAAVANAGGYGMLGEQLRLPRHDFRHGGD